MNDITHYTHLWRLSQEATSVLYNSTSICRRDLELQQISSLEACFCFISFLDQTTIQE